MKALRYMMAAVLVLALLCAGAAMAIEINTTPATNPMNSVSWSWNSQGGLVVPEGATSADLFTIDTTLPTEDNYSWSYEVFVNGTWRPVYLIAPGAAATSATAGTGIAAGVTTTTNWDYYNTADNHLDVTGEEMVRLIATSYNTAGEVVDKDTVVFYVDWNSDRKLNDRLTFAKWFPHNTACVYGPTMNTLAGYPIGRNNLTAAVVDLTKEGTQTFKLIAADMWDIGKVFVNVNGDEVTVTYQMTEDVNKRDIWDEIVVEKEWFTIFTNKSFITTANRNDLGDGYTFGAPISIANDLGGATTVVLYVNSTVTYGAHNPYVYRFWTNSRYETGARDAMMRLYNSVAD